MIKIQAFISFFHFLKNLLSFIIDGARVKTFPIVLMPVAMAGALAFQHTGILKKDILLLTALSALFIQVAVNFFNDVLDFKDGLDHGVDLGPTRLSSTRKMEASTVFRLGFLSCILAGLFGLPLVLRGGFIILIIGALSLLLTYIYTAGRFSLLKTGFSEICCFFFFGPVAVFGTYYLQTLQLSVHLIYLGIQCGFWALSILLINFLRDEKKDRQGGRKHLVTIYGRTQSLFLLIIIQAFIYLLCFYWIGLDLISGVASFLVLPFSVVWLYFICTTQPSKKYNSYLMLGSVLYAMFGGLWLGALLLFT